MSGADPIEGQLGMSKTYRMTVLIPHHHRDIDECPYIPASRSMKRATAMFNYDKSGTKRVILQASVSRIEAPDLRWNSLFQQNKRKWWYSLVRGLVIYFMATLFLAASSTPTVLGSVADQLIRISPEISESVLFLVSLSEPLGGLLFHSLPTITLAATVFIIPMLIIWITRRTPYRSHGSTERNILKRVYVFLTLAMLVVPTIILALASAYIEHQSIRQEGITIEVFQIIFVHSASVFWLNLLLQKTFLKNTFNILDLRRAAMYIIRRRFGLRIMSPRERIKAAEAASGYFHPSKEYAYLLAIQAMTFCFGILSPLLFVAGLLFMLAKYMVDRYRIWYIYEHMSDRHILGITNWNGENPSPPFGKSVGLGVDFASHRRTVNLVSEITMFNMVLFLAYMVMYFSFKVGVSIEFMIHVGITGATCVIVLVILIATHCCANGSWKLTKWRQRQVSTPHISNPNVHSAYRIPHPVIRQLDDQSTKQAV